MSMEWSDEARRACFGTCGGAISQHAPHEDIGCSMFEDTLRYLGPLVAAREAQAAARALREFGPWAQQEYACDPEEECPEGTCRLCDLLYQVSAGADDRADAEEAGR